MTQSLPISDTVATIELTGFETMALKPTIHKFNIALSDLDRDYYDTLNLTVARHPSETMERMMVRVLAYCINASPHLAFTKGVSAIDEPDLWEHSLDGDLKLWIDVGEPSVERVKKASHIARQVKVYSFNSKSDVWWKQSQGALSRLSASVQQFRWKEIQSLAALVQRTMDCSVTIADGSAFVGAELGECEISWLALQP